MYIRWLLIQLFYWTCVSISIILFPLSYPFHSKVKSKYNPIWWLISNHPVGYNWYWAKFKCYSEPKGFQRFWISYNWSVFRNGCWRLFNGPLKQRLGKRTDIQVIHNDGEYSAFTLLRMKFTTNGLPSDNVGDSIDLEKTFQGKNFVKYKIDGRKYFLYSYCKITDKKGREFSIGWNGLRPLIRNKTFRR